jgi:hypothetical protein
MIQFRPHHFLCAFCYQSNGYSDSFIKNFDAIVDVLNAPTGDSQQIAITNQTDDICAPCPHKRGQACREEEKIQQLDASHSEALNLNNLVSISWGEAKQVIKEKLTLEQFNEICAPCEWQALGICESVLRNAGVK